MEGTHFRLARPVREDAAGESGYALLLVFLMAAIIALALYKELPRVAFEAQRAKEELLIERGEQYKRAIQLFVRKVGRYPASIDELESFDNLRFLRKRYVDPMTGKDQWRLIHINGGVLTDSLVQKNKPGQDQQRQVDTNTFIAEGPVMGAASTASQQPTNPAMHRRASDSRPVVPPQAPGAAGPDLGEPAAGNGDDGNTGETAVAPGMPPGSLPQPGVYPGQPGYNPATASQPSGTVSTWPAQYSGLAGRPSLPNNTIQNRGQPPASTVYLTPTASQSSGSSVYVAPSLGQSPSSGDSVLLERMLHGDFQPPGYPHPVPDMSAGPASSPPRPAVAGQPPGGSAQPGLGGAATGVLLQNPGGGLGATTSGLTGPPGTPPAGGSPAMGGPQIGGGIAGVASEATGLAIMVYNQRQKYNEWEFVYDRSKDRGLAGVQRNGGVLGPTAQSMGSIPGQPPGMGGAAGSSTAAGQTGNPVSNGVFGGSSGFGPPAPQQPTN
jgi:hypothetical protein